MYVAALFTTGLIVLILTGLKPIEQRLFASRTRDGLSITVQDYESTLPALESIIDQLHIELISIRIKPGAGMEANSIQIMLAQGVTQPVLFQLMAQLSAIEGVTEVNHSRNHLGRT